jgi:hypothetical protein
VKGGSQCMAMALEKRLMKMKMKTGGGEVVTLLWIRCGFKRGKRKERDRRRDV